VPVGASGDLVTVDGAERIAESVARRLGLPGRPELLRSGRNHVFRAGDTVLRVTAPDVDAVAQVALAHWLSEAGLPVLRPLEDVVVVDGTQVSVWEHVDPSGIRPVDYRQLGAAVARLHRVPPSDLAGLVTLPWCGDAGWLDLHADLDDARRAGVVSGEDIGLLRAAAAELDGWAALARSDEAVVCHGDVHPQNVLMRGDQLVIIDWDSICVGPLAWDHAMLLTWAERWGGGVGDYGAFAQGYNADLRGSPLAGLLARVRLLAPTLNMVNRGASSPRHAAEARLRMRYWRGEPSPPAWTPQ
jgi:Ser/Thr protein kinase RdoA (MazF antagonist)